MNNLEVEFFYKSQNPAHIQILHLLERVIHESRRVGIATALRLINCDDPSETIAPNVPSLPCVRRVLPKPERLILAPLNTFADIASALGLQGRINQLSAVGLDIFQGNPGQITASASPQNS